MKPHVKEFYALFQHLHSLREIQIFLEDLLTPKELEILVERWQIVKRLARGMSQRAVRDELRTGVMTVTRGARALKRGSGGFRMMLERSAKR